MGLTRFIRGARAQSRGRLGGELLRGGFGSGGMRIAEVVLGVASAILLARQLGVAGLGVYSVAIATVTLAALPIEFGFPALVIRETARAHAQGDWDGVHAVLSFSTRAILLVSAVLGATAAILWPLLTAIYPEGHQTFAAALAIPPLVALANVRAAALRGIRKPLLGTAPESLIRPGAFVALLTGAIIIDPDWLGPARAAALGSAAAGLSLAFSAFALARHTAGKSRSRRAPIPVRSWLSAAFGLGSLRGLRVARPQILLLIVGAIGSVDAVGLFRIAQRGASLASFGNTTVVVLIAPYLAGLDAAGDRDRLQRLITVSARMITGAALVAFTIFLLAGGPLLGFLFGPEFEAAQPALVILSFAFVLTGILGPAQLAMTMLNRERVAVATLGVALCASTLLCAALAGPYGATGAAGADAAGLVTAELILWYMANRMLGLRTSVFGR